MDTTTSRRRSTTMSHRDLIRTTAAAFAAAFLTLASGAAAALPGGLSVELQPLPPPAVEATPPLPTPAEYPIQLVLDDDSAEGTVGVSDANGAKQFLWFNRFAAPGGPFQLAEVWVLFPAGTGMAVGAPIEIVVYRDLDGDPTNGAELLATFAETIQAVDGDTFSLYALAPSLAIDGGSGDVLIGVVPRFVVAGAPVAPAAVDTTASQGRSWIAVWSGDPPSPPTLPPDLLLGRIDDVAPAAAGNWMIRGFGTAPPVVEIPTVGAVGAGALGLVLLGAGLLLLRRRRRAAVPMLGLLLLGGLAPEPATAVLVDSFTTNQAAISDPPGGATSVAGGADIVGQRRDLVADLLFGAGPMTVQVSGGVLAMAVTATTPDSRGEARVTWDADSDPNVLDPVGLAGLDLTAGGHSSLELLVTSATAGSELVVVVYTDGANASRAALRLPAVAASTPFYLSYGSDFVPLLGGGADFSDVGAVTLTVRGTETSVSLDRVQTVAPAMASAKVDLTLADAPIGATPQPPGTTFKYRVTITNTGGEAIDVDLADTIDAQTTLDAASVDATPVAGPDAYGTFGNVDLSVVAAGGLLANDVDPDQNGAPPELVVTAGVVATALGGSATLAADGSFDYTPPIGVGPAVDTFPYTVTDNEGNAVVGLATVNLGRTIWFVQQGHPGTDQGTLANPFTAITAANVSGAGGVGDQDDPGDIIFLFSGTYAGIVLENDQQLIGQGVALVVDGVTLVPAGTPPTITAPGAGLVGVTLAQGDTVRGLTVGATGAAKILGNAFGTLAIDTVTLNGAGQALDLTNGTVAGSLLGLTTTSSAGRGVSLVQVAGSLTTGGTTVTNPTTQGILVNQSTVSVDFGNTSVTGTGTDRVSLQNNSSGTRTFGTLATSGGTGVGFLHGVGGGATTVTGATTITNPAGRGIDIQNANGAVTFAAVTVNKGASAGTGVHLQNNGAQGIGFVSLAVTTNNGTGLFANAGGTVAIGGSASTVAATGGPALDVTSTSFGAGGVTFATVSSTGSTGKGINLDTVTGPVTMNGGAIGTAAGIAFDLNAGSANVTYAGSITTTANRLVEVTGRTGGTALFSGALSSTGSGTGILVQNNNVSGSPIITFSNASKVLSTGTSAAVTLDNNDVATVNFTGGGLDIDTTTGIGFNAINGAAGINVTGTVNTIDSVSATALQVTNSSIGGSHLNFQRISSGNNTAAPDPTSGLILNSTGSLGRLIVAGNGDPCTSLATCTGGAIQNTTGDGVSLTSTRNVSLTRMYIANTGRHGVLGTQMTDATSGAQPTFELRNSFLESPGDADNESALYFDTLGAANITGRMVVADTTIQNFEDVGVHVGNNAGTVTIDLTNLTVSNNSDTNGEEGVDIEAQGTANMTVNVSGGTYTDLEGGGFNVFISSGSGVIDLNIDGTTITGTGGPDNFPTPPAITLSAEGGTSTLTFDITNNDILDSSGDGIFVGHEGTIMGRITGNDVSGMMTGDGLRIDTDATGGNTATILVDNNNFGNVAGNLGLGDDGIQVLHRDGTKVLNLTISNNQIGNTASEGIRYFADDDVAGGGPGNVLRISNNTFTNIGDPNTIVVISQDPGTDVCTNITGNTLAGAGVPGITLQQSLSAVLQITQASTAALSAANEGATVTPVGTITFNGACITPPQPTN